MKIVVQRINRASVSIDRKKTASVSQGLLVYIGVAKNDSSSDIDKLTYKLLNLRIFENESQKFDMSMLDIRGEFLVVSQFTLFADYTKGKRPFFGRAEKPDTARELYEKFVSTLKEKYYSEKVKSGIFGANMIVSSENEGPVTLILDSKEL